MSGSAFMVVIAALYLMAMVFYTMEGKYMWSLVAFSWSLGNAVLAYLSK